MEINTITFPFIFGVTVNCYLIKTENGFILIDTGTTRQRSALENALAQAGCKPGNFRLIILTHGDFDHCGNAAYLRAKYQTKVAIHDADCGMVEQGNMFWNRKQPNFIVKALMKPVIRLNRADQFKPDFTVKEGDQFSDYGFDAEVIELPGHSKGSIGLLTADGDLFCGDLLANTSKPDMWSIIDNREDAAASVEKLKSKTIRTVYPGHGRSFLMQTFWERATL